MILQTTDTPAARLACSQAMLTALSGALSIHPDMLIIHGLRFSGVSFPVAEAICDAYKGLCGINSDGTMTMPDSLPVDSRKLPAWIIEGLFDNALCQTCGRVQKSPETPADSPKERNPDKPLSPAQKKLIDMLEGLDAGVYEHRALCAMLANQGLTNNQAVYAINTLPASYKDRLKKHGEKSEEGRVLMVVKPLECSFIAQ